MKEIQGFMYGQFYHSHEEPKEGVHTYIYEFGNGYSAIVDVNERSTVARADVIVTLDLDGTKTLMYDGHELEFIPAALTLIKSLGREGRPMAAMMQVKFGQFYREHEEEGDDEYYSFEFANGWEVVVELKYSQKHDFHYTEIYAYGGHEKEISFIGYQEDEIEALLEFIKSWDTLESERECEQAEEVPGELEWYGGEHTVSVG